MFCHQCYNTFVNHSAKMKQLRRNHFWNFKQLCYSQVKTIVYFHFQLPWPASPDWMFALLMTTTAVIFTRLFLSVQKINSDPTPRYSEIISLQNMKQLYI